MLGGRRFAPGDAHALDGIAGSPVPAHLAIRGVAVWDGRGGSVAPGRCVVIREGLVSQITDAARPVPAG
jgi:hypothetical protein